jgi:S-adenosylmethionine synthetase
VSDDFIFTSESVTSGHPDKLCDQVSDAIIDHFLRQDPDSRIIAECALASGVMFISTHYASHARFDIPDIARHVIRDIGYPKSVFDADDCTILTSFMNHTATDYLPLDLDAMDDEALDQVPGRQQATVFGFACDQTPALMPLPIWLAHRLADKLDSPGTARKLPYLIPDGETQVGIEYRNCKPKRLHSITLQATQADDESPDLQQLRDDLLAEVIEPVLSETRYTADNKTAIFINHGGKRVGGGPSAHSGLTGRKTGIDSYGEYSRHSGAALSGKDPMRIDRIGAYAARYAAKNIVAAGLARECEVQLSYSIGIAKPVSMRVRTFGSGTLDDRELTSRIEEVFDFRPGAIARDLQLKTLSAEDGGFYRKLAVYGHMGRTDFDVPWEATDKADKLK